MSSRISTILVLGLVLVGSLVLPHAARAQTDTWTGNGGPATGWSIAGNWTPGSANAPPVTGDNVILTGNGANAPSNFDLGGVILHSVTLNASVGGYTINQVGANVLGLQSGGSITDNNTGHLDFFNVGVNLNGPATIQNSTASFLGFFNPITGTGPLTLVNNSGSVSGLQLAACVPYLMFATFLFLKGKGILLLEYKR
jgi:hypothetical protein